MTHLPCHSLFYEIPILSEHAIKIYCYDPVCPNVFYYTGNEKELLKKITSTIFILEERMKIDSGRASNFYGIYSLILI